MAKKLILLGIILMFASIATAETVYNPLTKGYADTLYCPLTNCSGGGASSSNLSANLSGVAYMNVTNAGNFTADNFFGWLNFSWIQNWMGTISALINGNFTLLDNKITNETQYRISNDSIKLQNGTDYYAINFNASWYNWKATDGWNIFNGINLTFNTTKLEAFYFNATQYDNISGKIDGGTLANTQHPNAAYDEVTLNFSEVSGSPGLDLRINFTSVDTFNQGIIRYKTSTLSGANPIIQVWNYINSAWEDYPTFGESLAFATVFQPVFDSSNHISNGVVQVRLYKSSNGNTNNHYYVDWVALQKGYSTFSGEEIDPKFTEKIKNYWNISQINETFPTKDNLADNMTGVVKNGTANNAYLNRISIGAVSTPYKLLINNTVSDETVFYINSPNSANNEAFAVRGGTYTNFNTGKAFSVTSGGSWSNAMFYTNGMFCIGSGSLNRDTCISRTGVNLFQIHNGSNTQGSLNITKHLYVGGNITGDINFSNVKNWESTLVNQSQITQILDQQTYQSVNIYKNEMFIGGSNYPWIGGAINSGSVTASGTYTTVNHPGVQVFRPSAIVNNSGYYQSFSSSAIQLGGNESTDGIILFYVVPGGNFSTVNFGFSSTMGSSSDPAHAVMFHCENYTCYGETQRSDARATTITNYTLTAQTWYHLRIDILNTSYVNFTITDSPYTTDLWVDSITNSSTIPYTATTQVVHGIKQYWRDNVTSAINGLAVDYIDFKINRVLQR